ncbi:hypothetical protein FB559_8293 [Actinoallomurus bryophytorum]|uniref:Uncharacterized protein n=1 Tax=Actinoallomurus bryophytorum TaxID=1490222 RepID=A0A543C1M3_9ACTN|nr:hypothetical protein FB559_8293 [Actinoallomurus bryophytorum]
MSVRGRSQVPTSMNALTGDSWRDSRSRVPPAEVSCFPVRSTGIIVNISVTKCKASLASCNHPSHDDSRNRRIGLDGLLILVFTRELDERRGAGAPGQTVPKASCGRTLVSTGSRISDHPGAYRHGGTGIPKLRRPRLGWAFMTQPNGPGRQRHLTEIVKRGAYRAACGHRVRRFGAGQARSRPQGAPGGQRSGGRQGRGGTRPRLGRRPAAMPPDAARRRGPVRAGSYLRERFSRIFMLISMGVPSNPNSSRSLRSMKRR